MIVFTLKTQALLLHTVNYRQLIHLPIYFSVPVFDNFSTVK